MKNLTHTFLVKAQGNSMYPILQAGDIIEYRHTLFNQIKVNDIILIHKEKILITHRVIYKTKKICITRGDNNFSADSTIQRGQILAKAIGFKRRGVIHDIQDIYFTQSALYLQEIKKLEKILQTAEVPHVFLKGVLISLRYQGAIPRRIYADCDILVRRNDEEKVKHLLGTLGYVSLERIAPFTHGKIKDQPEVSFMKRIKGIPVVFDVHFEPVFLMTKLGGMNLLFTKKELLKLGDEIIHRAKKVKIGGVSYTICSPADQILYLALHIFHHNFMDSHRYDLMNAVIKKTATKQTWNEVLKIVKEYHLDGYVYFVFILLRKYFKTPIPPFFITAVKPSVFKQWISRFFFRNRDIFSQDVPFKAGIDRFFLAFLLSPEPIKKKILLFFHISTISSAWGVLRGIRHKHSIFV